jgi:hypothetical protein
MSEGRLKSEITDIITNLDILKGRIVSGYTKKFDPAIVKQERELYTTRTQKSEYDAKFLEDQSSYQNTPKQRNQTLQEFVFLFFYVSLGIFSVALTIYSFLTSGQSYSEAAKTLGLCIVGVLAITAILIRMA